MPEAVNDRFKNINPTNLEKDWYCPICLDTEKLDVVAHTGEEEKHPMHRGCFKTALSYNDSCPVCRDFLKGRNIQKDSQRKIKQNSHFPLIATFKYSRRSNRGFSEISFLIKRLIDLVSLNHIYSPLNYGYSPFYGYSPLNYRSRFFI